MSTTISKVTKRVRPALLFAAIVSLGLAACVGGGKGQSAEDAVKSCESQLKSIYGA